MLRILEDLHAIFSFVRIFLWVLQQLVPLFCHLLSTYNVIILPPFEVY